MIEIIIGWWRYFFTQMSEEEIKRKEICEGCSIRRGIKCGDCGCFIVAKIKCPICECPKGKWI